MRRRGAITALLASALLVSSSFAAAASDETLVARPNWSMPDRVHGASDSSSPYISPFYEKSSVPIADIDPVEGFEVLLDGCASSGDIDTYEWRIGNNTVLGPTTSCTSSVRLPEGAYEGTLTVEGANGQHRAPIGLVVEDVLVVSMGDSYSSGEGVPIALNPAEPDTGWDHDNCHRSTRGGPALAAIELEEVDPRSSVTFIYLACASATVDEGILGPQKGRLDVVELPQVTQLANLAGDRQVDALIIGVGGNDIGFTKSLLECLELTDCWNASGPGGTLHERLQTRLARLRSELLPRTDACLTDGPCELYPGAIAATPLDLPAERIFYTEYPDLSKGRDLTYCEVTLLAWELSQDEFRWADQGALNGPLDRALNTYPPQQSWELHVGGDTLPVPEPSLNQQVRGSASLYSWSPVTGIYDDSRPHGPCSDEPWVFTPQDLITGATITDGLAHPNHAGQANYGRNIAAAVAASVGIPAPELRMPSTPTTAPTPRPAPTPAAAPIQSLQPTFTG